jgi:outer membrane lipoprotein SlyB
MSTPTVKSTQIVAGVAVVLALLGGAYAVGRSQSALPPVADGQPPALMQSEAPQPRENRPAERAPQRVASAESAREVQQARPAPAAEPSQTALCQSCGRVTDVHTETRKGQGSGVGAVGGAVVGGLLGNMVGGGTGKKIATVGGAVAGGYAGNEIEKNQKTTTVWVIRVEERDGRTRRFERNADPGLRVGDEVRLTDNGFSRL